MGFFCSEESGFVKSAEAAVWRPLARSSPVVVFLIALSLGLFFCTRYYLESSVSFLQLISGNSMQNPASNPNSSQDLVVNTRENDRIPPKIVAFPLNCSLGNLSRTCPVNYYPSSSQLPFKSNSDSSRFPPETCPDFFRWIHEDLWPWRETGISRDMVMSGRPSADFRLVIVSGRVYLETYRKAFQSRDTFTIWGILQLLRRYPGKVPDLELLFDCSDRPSISKAVNSLNKAAAFRYCGDDSSQEIVFPDWSFWGWPEINIKPWEALSKDLKEGNLKRKWTDREQHSYWKGNPAVSAGRKDLLKCHVSEKQDWNARIYAQDWRREQRQGFKQSNLADQCTHRYKIYIEGVGWSVSQKYILACDSVTLLVKPRYYDFFSRGLMPLKHYWPVKEHDKCRSIKHAVEWGNSHQQEAEAIGRAGSRFIHEELKMDYVYDYMFHLLNEYSKLLKYKPTVPEGAVEICSESVACPAQGLEKTFLNDSMVKGFRDTRPCAMPQPYDPASFHSLLESVENSTKKVDALEKQYWDSHR